MTSDYVSIANDGIRLSNAERNLKHSTTQELGAAAQEKIQQNVVTEENSYSLAKELTKTAYENFLEKLKANCPPEKYPHFTKRYESEMRAIQRAAVQHFKGDKFTEIWDLFRKVVQEKGGADSPKTEMKE